MIHLYTSDPKVWSQALSFDQHFCSRLDMSQQAAPPRIQWALISPNRFSVASISSPSLEIRAPSGRGTAICAARAGLGRRRSTENRNQQRDCEKKNPSDHHGLSWILQIIMHKIEGVPELDLWNLDGCCWFSASMFHRENAQGWPHGFDPVGTKTSQWRHTRTGVCKSIMTYDQWPFVCALHADKSAISGT